MRTIVFTGKGGVGKTSVAACTALRAADMGYKTLIMSTDPAHSLGDSFDMELGPAPIKVKDNLWGQEVSVYNDLNHNWEVVRAHFAELMHSRGIDDVYAEEIGILPGMEELFSLSYIKEYNLENAYDLLIVDCAPTGETLRLLSLPDTFGWVLKMIRNIEKYAVKPLIRPMAKMSKSIDKMVAPSEVFEAVEKLFTATDGIIDILSDNSKTSVRLVMNPEKMVIKESMRALTYLNLYGITVDQVVINRLMPADQDTGYLNDWKNIQHKYVGEIEKSFAPVPIAKSPLFPGEVVGLDMLRKMSAAVYGDRDPVEIFYDENPVEIKKMGGSQFQLRIKLPFVADVNMGIKLLQQGDDLTIRLGDNQKTITLPVFLAGLQSDEAYFDGKWLCVDFRQPGHAPETAGATTAASKH
ncbi:MAG: ArsA family ATPase [Chlorobiales bacterium]|jgi:arsenite/tail-anchored protein-transporting ATPase|nr:ArsA family ATPase [Chlorobiales bacterium]